MNPENITLQTPEDTVSQTEERIYHPPPGEWLFKIREEIYGPVTSEDIVDRMFSGEVDENTEVTQEEGEWRVIESIEGFRPFLIKAKATRQAERVRLEAEKATRRRRRRSVLKVTLLSVVVLSLGFMGSYYIIVHRSGSNSNILNQWAGKHLPLLRTASASDMDRQDFQAGRGDKGIRVSRIFIDDAPALVAIKRVPSSTGRRKTGKKKPTSRKIASLGHLTNEEITSVVYNKRNLQRFYSCIRSMLRKDPDLPTDITIEFSINNNGRAGQVRMNNIELEGGPLHQCLSKKIDGLRFRPFRGQVRNVTIPFNLQKN